MGDPKIDMGVSWVWEWANAWFERCQWMPCRVARVGWRIGQAVLDIYHIVVGSWSQGIQWAELLDRRSKWAALFIWTCILNVAIWWSSIVIYCTIVSFWRYVRLVFACTPFATLWWAFSGLLWMINYK